MMLNIEKLNSTILKWVDSNQYKDTFTFRMSKSAFDEVNLDASALAYDIYNILGVELDEDQKEKALNFLNSCQNKSEGFFYELDIRNKLKNHPDSRAVEMSSNYLTFQTVGSLRVFDALPKYKITFYDQFIEDKGIKHYLSNNCPWDRSPWGAGGMIDNLGTILDCNIRMGYKEYATVLEDLFEWLDENQSNKTGMWGNEEIQGINGLINGAYHAMRGTYFLQNKPFQYPELIIDNILKNILTHERFDNDAEGCHDLDHFYLLQKCCEMVPEYKTEEIQRISSQRLKDIMELVYCSDGAFSFEAKKCLDNHAWVDIAKEIKESDMLGTVFYLQTIISIYKILNKEINLNESKTHG